MLHRLPTKPHLPVNKTHITITSCLYTVNKIHPFNKKNLLSNKSRDLLQSYLVFGHNIAWLLTLRDTSCSSDSAHKNTSIYVGTINFTNSTEKILLKAKVIMRKIGGD